MNFLEWEYGEMATLVIDAGDDIVGVFSVEEEKYFAYRGNEISSAIRKIKMSEEIVTYNGENYDLEQLGRFVGIHGKLLLRGQHTDMRSICWSDRILGSSLWQTYNEHFTDIPNFPKTYEGGNERDVYMTFRLWQLWKRGKLKRVDGKIILPCGARPNEA